MLSRGMMTQRVAHVIAKRQAGPGTLESLLSPCQPRSELQFCEAVNTHQLVHQPS